MKRKKWLFITGIVILLIGIVGFSRSMKEKAETRMAEAEKGEREEEKIELKEGKKEEEIEEKEEKIESAKEGKETEKLTRLQKEYLKELKRLGKRPEKEEGGDESREATFAFLKYFQNLLDYVKSEKELKEILYQMNQITGKFSASSEGKEKDRYHYYLFTYYGFGWFGTLESNWGYLVVADKGKLSLNVLYEQTPYYLTDLYELKKGEETYLMITGRALFYHPYPIFTSIWKIENGKAKAVPLIYKKKDGNKIKVEVDKGEKSRLIEFTFEGKKKKEEGGLLPNAMVWYGYQGVQFEMKMKKKKKKIEFYCHGVGIEEPIARLYIRKGEAIIKEGEKMRGEEKEIK